MKIPDQKKRHLNFGGAPASGWTLTFHVLKIKAKGLSLIIRQPTMSCRLLLLLSIRIYYILWAQVAIRGNELLDRGLTYQGLYLLVTQSLQEVDFFSES